MAPLSSIYSPILVLSGKVCSFWVIARIKQVVKFLFGPYMVLCVMDAQTMGLDSQ